MSKKVFHRATKDIKADKNKTTELNVLAATQVRSLKCMTHPSVFMLEMATHIKNHIYTHNHTRIPVSCSHGISLMSHRHAQFYPLRQKTDTNTQPSMKIKDFLIR